MAESNRESERLSREMVRAAEEMSKVAEEIRRTHERTWRDYARIYRELVYRELVATGAVDPEKLGQARISDRFLVADGLPEEETAIIADQSVHRVRKDLARRRPDEPKAPPPTTKEIKEWERRREERRKREAS